MSDPVRVWRDQPIDELEIRMQPFLTRRADELRSKTRSEILVSILAATFFVAVVLWRFRWATEPLQQAVLVLTVVWIVASLYWFRDRLRQRLPSDPSAKAVSGLDYYRRELQERRDYLRNAWISHGPVLLACFFFLLTILGGSPSWDRFSKALPFVICLIVWIGAGIYMRSRQATQIEQELIELSS